MHLSVLFTFSLLFSALSLTTNDFRPALFSSSKPSGFYNIHTGPHAQGYIFALADLNGDKFTDYVASQNQSQPTITIYLWDAKSVQFNNISFELQKTGFLSVSEIMVCDVDQDGLVELVVTYMTQNSTYSSQIYDTDCYSSCKITLQLLNYALLENMTALPFLLDRKGNGAVQIFTFKGTSRSIISYNHTQLQEQSWSDVVNGNAPEKRVSLHFASQLDINGDCNADLVIVSQQTASSSLVQFYKKDTNSKYSLYKQLQFAFNITWLTFGDLDESGSTDILIVASQNNSFIPYILPNSMRPSTLCSAFSSFPFSIQKLAPLVLPSGWKFLHDSSPHLADYNFDGLPDILAIFSINQLRKTSILGNRGNFKFELFQSASVMEIEAVGSPVQAAVFDFAQDGKLDVIIITSEAKDDHSTAYVRTSIFNNIIEDSLFIKILPLLATGTGDGLQRRQVSGGIGVTIQWLITDLNGDKSINLINQRPQWNFGTLNLPFVSIGLGRTNNYIQDLTVGYAGAGQVVEWTPVIPNSQLMVQRRLQGEWELQTLLQDNGRVYDVIYISVVCLLVLGLIVLFLGWRERQQDKRNQYNFVQMIR